MSSTFTKEELKLRKYEKTKKVFVRTSFIGIFLLLFMLSSMIVGFFKGRIGQGSHHYNRMQATMIVVFLLPIFYFIGMCDYLPKGQKPKSILRVLITSYVVLLLGTFITALTIPFLK